MPNLCSCLRGGHSTERKGECESLQDFFHSDVSRHHEQEESVHHEAGVCGQGGEGRSHLKGVQYRIIYSSYSNYCNGYNSY